MLLFKIIEKAPGLQNVFTLQFLRQLHHGHDINIAGTEVDVLRHPVRHGAGLSRSHRQRELWAGIAGVAGVEGDITVSGLVQLGDGLLRHPFGQVHQQRLGPLWIGIQPQQALSLEAETNGNPFFPPKMHLFDLRKIHSGAGRGQNGILTLISIGGGVVNGKGPDRDRISKHAVQLRGILRNTALVLHDQFDQLFHIFRLPRRVHA